MVYCKTSLKTKWGYTRSFSNYLFFMKFSEKILKVKVLNSRWDANYIIEIRWGSYSLQKLKGFSITWECQSDIKILHFIYTYRPDIWF